MAIEVTHDGEREWQPGEPCAFCSRPTRYWFTPKDVAVCLICALAHEAADVPSKKEWFVSNEALRKV
jgi:hypothetical protein